MKYMHTDVRLNRDDDWVVGKVSDDRLEDVDVLDLVGGGVSPVRSGAEGTYRDEAESQAVDVEDWVAALRCLFFGRPSRWDPQ